jgi:uncharacterized protein YciI
MYVIAILRYREPLEKILPVVDRHRAYLGTLRDRGILLASGPLNPRYGGALLLRVPDDAGLEVLDRLRDEDPFVIERLAQYEILPWEVGTGKEKLDSI